MSSFTSYGGPEDTLLAMRLSQKLHSIGIDASDEDLPRASAQSLASSRKERNNFEYYQPVHQQPSLIVNVPPEADKSRQSYQDGTNLRGIVLGDPAKYVIILGSVLGFL